jgi:hypothetical protein
MLHVSNPHDAQRKKPRASLVLSPDEREAADRMADERRWSLSQFVGWLIREQVKRERKKAAK